MSSTLPAPAAGDGLSELARVVDTFVAPTKTFVDILRSAAWWLPAVLLVIFSTCTTFVVERQVGFDRVSENQIHTMPSVEERMNALKPEDRAAQMTKSAQSTRISTYAAPVFIAVFLAVYALVVWMTFNFGLGASTKYAQVLGVAWYAALPYLITPVLTIITLYAGNNAEAYDARNPVGTNPAYFLPDLSPVVKALLSSLDLVKIWSDVLMVIGMAVIAKKSLMQSAVIVFGYWLVGVLVTVGIAAAF